ncbi:MAG: hypothetical protein ACNA7Y_04820, partial [Gammaproteobacteria bacterium]
MLIQTLQNSDLYDHPVKKFRVLETHGAWVLLTGFFAYKIKKPVNFVFLDYSTLEKRLFFCQEELRLNQLLAAELYEEIVPITGTAEKPMLNGTGPIIDYAIKMKEFPQENLFSQLLKNNQLSLALIDQLAIDIADFHAKIPSQNVDNIQGPVQQNFDQIRPLIKDHTQLNRLEVWA